MQYVTKEQLSWLEALYQKRKEEIRNTKDVNPHDVGGTTYYVSSEGNDTNDGRSPDTAWKTLLKVSSFCFLPGDCVRFRRGDTFRGTLNCQTGVTYTGYGDGEKPQFYGWSKSLCAPELWVCIDDKHHIWKFVDQISDCGTLVFNNGEFHSRKLIPSYIRGKFVCREDESKLFDMASEMTLDLDIFCYFVGNQSEIPSKGENFPVPTLHNGCDGDLYLRCDRGNPGDVFDQIEAVSWENTIDVGSKAMVHIDNICMKYAKFGVSARGYSMGLHVTNCEIGWIGGNIQFYEGLDPNYPEGTRGSVTRFGNGIEVYGGCEDYMISNCYIYEVYDAAITHQMSTNGQRVVMRNIKYTNNLIENCVYGIEYFLDKNAGNDDSFMEQIEMSGNIILDSGYGWGQQRHNKHTPAHIKGWSYDNTASEYRIHNNIFGRAAYRMLHLVAKKQESCPIMRENIYIQDLGATLGQYGSNEVTEPENLAFDKHAEVHIKNIFHEENPTVFCVQS